MDESQEKQVSELMAEGLDQYGMGQTERAVECWRKVLEIDPGNAVAQDFLSTAGAEDTAEAEEEADAELDQTPLDMAISMLRTGDLRGGLDVLQALERESPGQPDLLAYVELARSQLLPTYHERIGPGSGVPSIVIPAGEVMKYNLPANAGFVLSTIDGVTSVQEIVSLSGMDPFEVLYILASMLEAGIIGVQS